MNQVIAESRDFWLPPELSDEALEELSQQIRPVANFGWWRGGLRYLKPINPRNRSLTANPRPDKKARGLKMICVMYTHHPCRDEHDFRVTIAQVLAQIPEKHLDRTVAFEVSRPSISEVRSVLRAYIQQNGYCTARTRLYSRA